MLLKKELNEICCRCLWQGQCINIHSNFAKKDHSCYEESGCFRCPVRTTCITPSKDKEAFNLKERFVSESPIPNCYTQPSSCHECSRNTHCANKYSKNFELDLSDLKTPLCFGSFHSHK